VEIDFGMSIAGLVIGTLVGLTGMGGGALMTPILVLFFHVDTLTAISSDLVVSLFMKPAGAIVHIYRKTVNYSLVFWLCVGSVPGAFGGALLIAAVPDSWDIDTVLKRALGVVLLLATIGLITRVVLGMVQRNTIAGEAAAKLGSADVVVRPVVTLLVGAAAGIIVGMTSVGAGSIIIVAMLLIYPTLKASQLVGTDLVQAIPLVLAATLGHFFFGEISLQLAASLLIGAIPGAVLGGQISSRVHGGFIRRLLAILLLASALKLLEVPTEWVIAAALFALVAGQALWVVIRRRIQAAGARKRTEAKAAAKAERHAVEGQSDV
jgi:uncharacterized membrane protein YfcA